MSAGNHPREWYELATPGHFWMEWRFRVLQTLLRERGVALDRPRRALDVWCRAGTLRLQLERAGAWIVDGTDPDPEALLLNPPLRGDALPWPLPAPTRPYDVALLFDVLEHVEDESVLLRQVRESLAPGARLFVNVPALPRLLSRYDEAAGHLRRYDEAGLRAALSGGGFEVEDTRSWGLSLAPLLAARKLLAPLLLRDGLARHGFTPPGALTEALLRALMRLEVPLCPRPPFGASLMACARRR